MTEDNRRCRFAFGVVAVILTIWSCGSEEQPVAEPARLDIIRVLDINVWSGLDYEGFLKMGEYETAAVREKRYQALLRQIKELNPDIVGVHEANKLPDYAERLAADLGFDVNYHVGVAGVRLGKVGVPWNLREGDAILTRPSLQAEFAGRKQLSGGHVGSFFTFHFSDATQVLAVRVIDKGRPLYVFATHWHASLLATPEVTSRLEQAHSLGEISEETYTDIQSRIEAGRKWRLREAEKTAQFIEKIAEGQPYILMGDFNATENAVEIERLRAAGAIDAFRFANPDAEGFTWDPKTNLNCKDHYIARHRQTKPADFFHELKRIHEATPKRIDYIFAGPAELFWENEISIETSAVAINRIVDGVHASDHFGVYADLRFE